MRDRRRLAIPSQWVVVVQTTGDAGTAEAVAATVAVAVAGAGAATVAATVVITIRERGNPIAGDRSGAIRRLPLNRVSAHKNSRRNSRSVRNL